MMKLKVSNAADRDQMVMILARNGYTVRLVKDKPAGSKTQVHYVEVVEE